MIKERSNEEQHRVTLDRLGELAHRTGRSWDTFGTHNYNKVSTSFLSQCTHFGAIRESRFWSFNLASNLEQSLPLSIKSRRRTLLSCIRVPFWTVCAIYIWKMLSGVCSTSCGFESSRDSHWSGGDKLILNLLTINQPPIGNNLYGLSQTDTWVKTQSPVKG